MQLKGRRESTNVEDRRGMSTGKKAGIGIGGIIIALLIAWISGQNPMTALTQIATEQMAGGQTETVQREFTAEEQRLATFSKQILAGTEDVWADIFRQNGMTYENPTLVLFTDMVQSRCGNADASVGPFYCSGDQKLYIDLSFFTQMKRQLGADGDFSYAYVIAHEVGHHVENQLGILNKIHAQMNKVNKTEANHLSVRLELLADFLAGVWAYHDNRRFGSLEDGDIEKAIQCAQVIGDDYLQKKARGYAQPETFNHGTSAQRMKWFKQGLMTGDLNQGNTILNCNYSDL